MGVFAILGDTLANIGLAVSAADPAVFWTIITVLCVAAALSAWHARHNLRCKRMIEDIPTSKARSAPQGYVELYGRGRLMDGPPIVSPVSGKNCVWYRYRVEEQDSGFQRGSWGTRWTTVDRGESTEVFWLEDDTGRVAIDPEGAEVSAGIKSVWYGAGNRRYSEERIDSGMSLFALGLLRNIGNLDNTPDVDQDVGDLLVEWKKDQSELKRRFDLNHDGEIDQQEWMLARQQARREVLKRQREAQVQPDEPINLMQPTGDPDRPYLLSTCAQGTLARRYRKRAMLYVVFVFASAITAMWLLDHRFGYWA